MNPHSECYQTILSVSFYAEENSYFELSSLSEKELVHFELFFDDMLLHFIKRIEAYQAVGKHKNLIGL